MVVATDRDGFERGVVGGDARNRVRVSGGDGADDPDERDRVGVLVGAGGESVSRIV